MDLHNLCRQIWRSTLYSIIDVRVLIISFFFSSKMNCITFFVRIIGIIGLTNDFIYWIQILQLTSKILTFKKENEMRKREKESLLGMRMLKESVKTTEKKLRMIITTNDSRNSFVDFRKLVIKTMYFLYN